MNKSRRYWLVLVVAAAVGLPASVWSCSGGGEYLPPLSYYEGRLPGRSLGRILLETGRIKAPTKGLEAFAGILQVAAHIGELSAVESIKEVEEMLEQARQHHWSKSEFAQLHDLRDLIIAQAVPAETMREYQEKWSSFNDDQGAELVSLIKECEAGTKPKGLLPHFLYAMGAMYFHAAKDVESEKWFARVVKEFPYHPRAEAAMFMVARSLLSQTRGYAVLVPPDTMEARQARALKAFADYRQRYPKGSFVGDSLGWEGALHYDVGEYLEALRCYAQQLRFPGHPELVPSAIPMCERCLRNLCRSPKNQFKDTLAAVINDPALTTALVYHVLWTPPPYVEYGEPPVVDSKKWRQDMLLAIAGALPAVEKNFAGEAWQPRFLAILAQALSGVGQQREALAMLDRNTKAGGAVEEWCFARAVVLERMERLKEALAAYDAFIQRFPDSTWLTDVQRRKAGTLKDMGESDRAVLLIQHETDPPTRPSESLYPESDAGLALTDSALEDNLSVCTPYNREQTLEALFYGAPVEQLARLTTAEDFNVVDREALKKHLARRLIAQRRYADAAAMLPPEQAKAMGLKELAGHPDAATWLKLGKTWSAARGHWLASLPRSKDEVEGVVAPPSIVPDMPLLYDAHVDLKDAMRTLHCPDAEELLHFDELAHALEFYRQAIAGAAAKSKTGAEARLLALDAMPVLARSTGPARDFARKSQPSNEPRHWWQVLTSTKKVDWSSESRRWWQELQSAPPGTPNVARAAYWSFGKSPPSPDVADARRDLNSSHRWVNSRWDSDPDFIFEGFKLQEEPNPDYAPSRIGLDYNSRGTNLLDEIADLQAAAAKDDAARLRTDSEALLRSVEAANPLFTEAFVLNALRDLCAAEAVPEVTDKILCVYADFRIACLCNAAWGEFNLARHKLSVTSDAQLLQMLHDYRRAPQNAPLADFYDALEVSIEANHGLGRDWQVVERLGQEFLANHPQSSKRETVYVHLARASYRARRPQKSKALVRPGLRCQQPLRSRTRSTMG